MVNYKMARESRKIINLLNEYATINDVQGFIIPAHIYIADCMISTYNSVVLLSMLKSRLKSLKNPEWKHFTTVYWQPILHNMIREKPYAINDEQYMKWQFDPLALQAYSYIISEFEQDDYSQNEAKTIIDMVTKFQYQEIIDACKIAQQYNAGSIGYAFSVAVTNKNKANNVALTIQSRASQIMASDAKINSMIQGVKQYSPIDVATAQYQLAKERENAELQRLLEEITNNEDDN